MPVKIINNIYPSDGSKWRCRSDSNAVARSGRKLGTMRFTNIIRWMRLGDVPTAVVR